MIVGHINNCEKELYSPVLIAGLKFLAQTDFSKWENGRHEIDGDNMVAIVQEYLPDIRENRKAETHGKYIDIQYLVAGEEIIGYCNLTTEVEVAEDCLVDRDAVFYKALTSETDVRVLPGMYAIFFPWDIHRPGCVSKPGISVRKVVLKLKL